MRINTQDYDEVTVIALQGDLDIDSVEQLRTAAVDTIARSRAGVVLDMRAVGFIDGRGLEQLLWLRDYCSENKCDLRLAGLDENCRKILEITRLDNEFDWHAELAAAVKSFA
jgi:anti-anti-sigma factor